MSLGSRASRRSRNSTRVQMNSLSKRRSNNLARSKARRKRLDRIRKRLAVGTLREVRLFAEVRSVIPSLGRAYTLNTGKTQTILYKDPIP